jgi:CheY-like chemotaxis protein
MLLATMLSCTEVLVASGASRFADDLVEALRDEGALVVCVEEPCAVADALHAGFHPDAFVVDGALPGANGLVEWIRHTPGVPHVPLVAVSPSSSLCEPNEAELILVKRNVSDLVQALDRLCEGEAPR